MSPTPSLLRRPTSSRRRGLVLVLHGGAERDTAPVTRTSRPWLRALLLAAQLTPTAHRVGLDVWLLRYREVGWNAAPGVAAAPVLDARWALERARGSYAARSVVVVGHSMGARTGLAVAADPLVRGLIGLAPWFPPGESVDPVRGKDLVALHGRRDTVTSYAETEALLARAARVAARTEMVDMGPRGHTMVDGLPAWNAAVRHHLLAMSLR